MTAAQRKILDVYVYTRPQWLGELGSAIAVGLRAVDAGTPVPVETVSCLRDRAARLADFPELQAAVKALLARVTEAA
jgi:hypothetical protein